MLVDLEKWMRKWDLLTEEGSLNNAVWVSDGVSLAMITALTLMLTV